MNSHNKQSSPPFFVFLLGNCLEIFEFSLYGIYSKLFAEMFFSSLSQNYGMILSLGIFAAGFIARPFGAIIFGYIGDRYGRKRALIFSASLMFIATFGMGILPSSSQCGIIAPILLLSLRIMQGISCGGEYNGVGVYLFEYFKGRPGKAGALTAASGMTGTLLAIFLSYLSTKYIIHDWGWRLPFLMSAVIGMASLYARFNLVEEQKPSNIHSKDKSSSNPLLQLLRCHLLPLLSTLCMGGFNGALTFSLVVYCNIFLTTYGHIDFSQALLVNMLAVVCFIISCFSFCFIRDKYKINTSYFIMSFGVLMVFLSYVIYHQLLKTDIVSILVGEVILAIIAGGFSGLCNVMMCELFEYNIRYSGVAIGYSIGVSLFGGTIPSISHILITYTGSPYSAMYCLSIAGFIGFIGGMIAYSLIKRRIGS